MTGYGHALPELNDSRANRARVVLIVSNTEIRRRFTLRDYCLARRTYTWRMDFLKRKWKRLVWWVTDEDDPDNPIPQAMHDEDLLEPPPPLGPAVVTSA